MLVLYLNLPNLFLHDPVQVVRAVVVASVMVPLSLGKQLPLM